MPPAATPAAPNPTAPRATGAATIAAAAPPSLPLFFPMNSVTSSKSESSLFEFAYQESFLFSLLTASAELLDLFYAMRHVTYF